MTAPFSASNDDVDSLSSSQSACISQDTRNGNIKVAVRLCPVREDAKGPRKKGRSNHDCIAWGTEKDGTMESLIENGHARKVEGRTVFHFDQIFDEKTQTPLVYQSIARPMVASVLNGKHATIFAYGQTGSGKTFTMQGGSKVESGQAGIIQLVATDLFRFMRKDEMSKRKFEVKVSYFEIYNEKIRDLLADFENASHDSNSSSSTRHDQVKIRTNERGEIVVNTVQKKVKNADEALMMLFQGNIHRTVAATDMNAHSSRSHSVFRLTVESRTVDEDQPIDNRIDEIFRISDFNLVDLAGSESLKATKTTGIRQREGATINKSLLALTSVIQALSQPVKKKPQHINYRDSKLTRILQPHLSGNAEMTILCCASRSKNYIEETRSTLKFASRAKLVQMKAKINEVMDDGKIIRNLQNRLYEVQKELELAREKLQEELARKPLVVKPTLNAPNTARRSSTCSDINADERTNESQDSTANSSSEYDRLNEKRNPLSSIQKIVGTSHRKSESNDSPVSSQDGSFDGPDEDCPDFSLNMCSQVSNPETIRGTHGVDHAEKSFFGSQDSESFSPNGRLENNLSCDAMILNPDSIVKSGKPFRAIESLNEKRNLVPDEITIIESSTTMGDYICLTDRLKNSELRIQFLEEKLELSDTVIEANFRDLQRARQCIRDLVQRNVEMKVELSKKGREDAKKNYEKGEIIVEQYWILKVSLYGSVFFFLSGSQEYFLATAFFVWLALEMNVTA